MATQDLTGEGALLGKKPYNGINRIYVKKAVIDLTGALPDADGEVYQVLAIPAETLVLQTKCKIITASTATTYAMDFGDGSGANSWDNDVNMKAAAGTWTESTVGTDAYAVAASMGKFYSAADSIDAVIDATTTQDGLGPKFEVSALCVDYS
jgi:hypothetical protein